MGGYGQFKDFTNLEAALTVIWRREFVETSAVAPLFNIKDSASASERTKGLGSMGMVPEKTGSELKRKELDPLDKNEYIHKEYSDYISIPLSFIEDQEYNLISDMLTEYSGSYDRTWVYHMSSVFNNAFDSNFTGADGKALCVASGRATGKLSLNNKGTTALSATAVADTRKAMMKFKDANGLYLMTKPDTLVVGTDLSDEGMVIVGSDRESGTANNDMNTLRTLKLIVDPLIEGNNWFLADSAKARRNLRWWWRVKPTGAGGFVVNPASDFNGEVQTRGRMRYSYGWDDAAWIYGHEVA